MAVSKEELRAKFVGKTLDEVPIPSVILDQAKLRVNCERMLDTVNRLGLGWRAHIKTHKTVELTRLQVGDTASTDVNIIVSTVLEAENIVPLLLEYKSAGRNVNVLYSFPLHASAVPRLAKVSAALGPGGLSVLIDHADQLPYLEALRATSSLAPLVFIKVDMGYRRAGIAPEAPDAASLVRRLLDLHGRGTAGFHGLYTHGGHSYDTRRDWDALAILEAEFDSLAAFATLVEDALGESRAGEHPLVLSVGATPTATTLQHPSFGSSSTAASPDNGPESATITNLRDKFARLQKAKHTLEVHAGVYPVLDLQQLATHARDPSRLNASHIAISVLAEVASLYPGRGRDGTTEALATAGSLALGREPCKDLGQPAGQGYAGWGVVAPWRLAGQPVPGSGFPAAHAGWQVGRISQEHGVLTWSGHDGGDAAAAAPPLAVGQRIRIWPNHACIAGAGYDWYLIVDGSVPGQEDVVVDVWPRWRGW